MTTLRRVKFFSGENKLLQRGGHRENSRCGQSIDRSQTPSAEGLFFVIQNVVDRLLNVGDFLSLVVRNFALELFFESHHQLDRIQRIRAQVVNKRRLILYVGFIHTELFCDNLSDALFDIFHQEAPSKSSSAKQNGAILPNWPALTKYAGEPVGYACLPCFALMGLNQNTYRR
jgi:hypothetical protein